MKRTRRMMIAIFGALLLLTGCVSQTDPTQAPASTYQQITQAEAVERMAQEDGHVIVDVRRQDEYDAGHIPGAILIPNESIETTPPAELPDKAQIILVYCRSGRRSKEAAQKLADMGYANVYEFGGILTWEGEITTETEGETDMNHTSLSFESFDGGGPSFSAIAEDESLLTWEKTVAYANPDHEQMDGSAFTVTFAFTGLKPGSTKLTIEQRSPISGNLDHIYTATVDERLRVSLELVAAIDLDQIEAIRPRPVLVIEANGKQFYATLEDNSSAEAFTELLREGPLAVELHDYGGFEKVGPLPAELPRNDEPITTQPGDVILYQGSQITIYYDENTWTFTRLARIGSVTKEALLKALGPGDVTVTFWLEWSE